MGCGELLRVLVLAVALSLAATSAAHGGNYVSRASGACFPARASSIGPLHDDPPRDLDLLGRKAQGGQRSRVAQG